MILCKSCIRDQRFIQSGGYINKNLDLDLPHLITKLKHQKYEWGKCSKCDGPLTKQDVIKFNLKEQRKERDETQFRINVEKIERGEINIMGGMDPLMRKYKGEPITGIGIIEYESGKLKTEIHYKDGYQIRLKHFYENGLIKSDSNVKRGQLHGTEKTYYETGEIESKCNYQNDEGEGLFTKYYRTGQIENQGELHNTEPEGIWKYFYKNGQLQLEVNYKDSISISMKSWNENGEEIQLQKWKNINELQVSLDFMTGKEKYTLNNESYSGGSFENYSNGNIKCVTEYNNGIIESKTNWDEEGNKIEYE
tara:strand:+ start:79 stop:1002 length:924 start_codon:yes stop_codon:yes gene_type:complete